MRLKNRSIVIRLNDEAMVAYIYLRSIKVNPAVYFRDGGEAAVIAKANEMKKPKQKEDLPF